ncbi:MAG TPA: response regulator [Thermoanaerobaculia bacterium]|jgi:CheY-like chemotaxis protein
MFVDGDPQVARLMAMIAVRHGYACEVVIGGREAIRRVQRAPEQYAAIFTDLLMSPVHGDRVAAAVRADPRARHINLILVSSDRDIAETARAAGFHDYLGKPFEFDDVAALLKRYAGPPLFLMHCLACDSALAPAGAPYNGAAVVDHLQVCLQSRLEAEPEE